MDKIKEKNKFDGTINISSNIKANKNCIIGKFDIKDLFFILVAIIVGIGILSVMLGILNIRNMFIIFLILAIFEIPILSLGFLKIHNMEMISYLKMKRKSDNSTYRKQEIKTKIDKADKFIIPIVIENNKNKIGELIKNEIEDILKKIKEAIPYNKIEIKIMFNKIFLLFELKEEFQINYEELINYIIKNKIIKYISFEEIKIYETYIKSLKMINKKYDKEKIKLLNRHKEKLKKLTEINTIDNKEVKIANEIIKRINLEYTKIIKFSLYEHPINLEVFEELIKIADITSHISIKDEKIEIEKLNLINTYLQIYGENEEEVTKKYERLKTILENYKILYKEIEEEKVKESLMFIMESKY